MNRGTRVVVRTGCADNGRAGRVTGYSFTYALAFVLLDGDLRPKAFNVSNTEPESTAA